LIAHDEQQHGHEQDRRKLGERMDAIAGEPASGGVDVEHCQQGRVECFDGAGQGGHSSASTAAPEQEHGQECGERADEQNDAFEGHDSSSSVTVTFGALTPPESAPPPLRMAATSSPRFRPPLVIKNW
jgi:hypothetical protein